jgi:hypothetical protein
MKPLPQIQVSVVRLQCSACGAEANASCSCGKPYIPVKQRIAIIFGRPANVIWWER